MQGFFPQMSEVEVNKISMLGLAHVGDGVYELLVRSLLCRRGYHTVAELHALTVRQVNAVAQAGAMERLLPLLEFIRSPRSSSSILPSSQ